MKNRLFVLVALVTAFFAGTQFELKKQAVPEREELPSPTVSLGHGAQDYDVATSLNTSVEARRLELTWPIDGYCLVRCLDAKEQFLVQLPEDVDVKQASNKNGVTFSKNGKVFLVLLNQRFSGTGKYEWFLGSAAYVGEGRWIQMSSFQKELTRSSLQSEINAL